MDGNKDASAIPTIGAAEISPHDIFSSWIARFSESVERRDAPAIAQLFAVDGYWRDILAFTWERPTFFGRAEIAPAFAATIASSGVHGIRIARKRASPRLVKRSGRSVVEGWFEFDVTVGLGAGFVRLLHDEADPLNPQIWLLLTTLHTLRGGEEKIGDDRPSGDEYSKIHSTENWKQIRDKAQAFEGRDPQVLIVGAGQGGLMLAARLRQMGVECLVVEKNARVGDNWRGRYNNLTIHNETTANHFPYLKFPETWPLWLPKDMLANWLESYAEFMELNVWCGAEIADASFDESSKEWLIRLRRSGGAVRTMRCKHLVAAMGVSGGLQKKPQLKGIEAFNGKVIHSGEFTTGAEWRGKNAIVVGTGNSGHDIAQDLHVSGAASVSMIQRGETCVVSLDPSARISYAIYNEGVEPEDIDLMTAAIPYPLLIESYKFITKRTSVFDRDLLDGLNKAGFKTHIGEDETGFQLLYLRSTGGYYIDVGCSQLIIDGKVPVIQFEDTERFVAEGLRMKDGTVQACDLVVLATGFESMQDGIRRMLGDAVADRLGRIWGFDEDYNMRNMWKRTAQDGLWIMGGAILEARLNSRFLALEIKASIDGLLPDRNAMPLRKLSSGHYSEPAA